jgi:hypothetical protein
MSIKAFGQPYTEVHLWLDEFFASLGARHRRKRHHLKGIEEVRRRWGDRAADAAKQHIIDDLKGEGWKVGDHFPVDEADYVRMGLFCERHFEMTLLQPI